MEKVTQKWSFCHYLLTPMLIWKVRGSFIVFETFLELHGKTALQRSPKQQKQMGLFPKLTPTHKKTPLSSSNVIKASRSFGWQNWFEKMLLALKVSTVAAELKLLAHTPSEVVAWAWLSVECVNNVILKPIWALRGLLETWLTLCKQHRVILCFSSTF